MEADRRKMLHGCPYFGVPRSEKSSALCTGLLIIINNIVSGLGIFLRASKMFVTVTVNDCRRKLSVSPFIFTVHLFSEMARWNIFTIFLLTVLVQMSKAYFDEFFCKLKLAVLKLSCS